MEDAVHVFDTEEGPIAALGKRSCSPRWIRSQEWMPHEYVAWSLGRDFKELGGNPWSVDRSQPSQIARTAFEANLLRFECS